MKCEPAREGPCKRCRNNGTECVFKPRANARQSVAISSPESIPPNDTTSSEVMARLAVIESILGIGRNNGPISSTSSIMYTNTPIIAHPLDEDEGDPNLSGLWQATAALKAYTGPEHLRIWSRSVVSQLWLS
jgi:hypothetical protein